MKRIILIPAFALLFFSSYAQPISENSEFTKYTNGLMYSDGDMKTLRFIVDSLNLRFKTCDLSRKYYSMPQGKFYTAYFVSETNDLKSIVADLGKISFPELVSKYSSLLKSYDTSRLLIQGKDYSLSGTPLNGYDYTYLSDDRKPVSKIKAGKWVHKYSKPERYTNYYSLHCYYFPGEIRSVEIPVEYAKLIQYVDCMIDTSAVIFLTDKKEFSYPSSDNSLYGEINDFLNSSMKTKKQGKDDWVYTYITAEKINYARENLKNNPRFTRLIEDAAEELVESGGSNDAIEALIGEFVSKEKALYLKRCRRVVGQCSQDDSPRQHARNIALLAAEAHQWDIFLRAHLDIMNDRFERMSDGSYAWGNAKHT